MVRFYNRSSGTENWSILLDGKILHADFLRAWQRNIAKVNYNVTLAERTMAKCIAFKAPYGKFDLAKVSDAGHHAKLDGFIGSSKKRFATLAGKSGMQLFVGQRQWIEIACALRNQAQFLIFDEATSALDGETEALEMDSIYQLSREPDFLIIAHPTVSIKKCDLAIGFLDDSGPAIFNQIL